MRSGPAPAWTAKREAASPSTALVALGRLDELELHVRAAVRNGLTEQEIGSLPPERRLLRAPAANSAFAVAQRVLSETGEEE